MVSIRGAITVDENSRNSILNSTKELIRTIEKYNHLTHEDVVSIIFSCTDDLDKIAPARAARELGYVNASLMNFNEMKVENGLEKCIRVMLLCNLDCHQNEIKHVYLRKAKILRPDLI